MNGDVLQRHFNPNDGTWWWGKRRRESIDCDGVLRVNVGCKSAGACRQLSVLAAVCHAWVSLPVGVQGKVIAALLDPTGPVHARNVGWLPITTEQDAGRRVRICTQSPHLADLRPPCVPLRASITDIDGLPLVFFDASLHGVWRVDSDLNLVSPAGRCFRPWATFFGQRVAVPGVGLLDPSHLVDTDDLRHIHHHRALSPAVQATVDALCDDAPPETIASDRNLAVSSIYGHIYTAFVRTPLHEICSELLRVIPDDVWDKVILAMRSNTLLGPLNFVETSADVNFASQYRLARFWLLKSECRRRATLLSCSTAPAVCRTYQPPQ